MENCVYGGQEYSPGAEVCQGTVVKQCVAGTCEDTGRTCGEVSVTAAALDVTPTIARTVSAQAVTCCQFFSIGQITVVGLRNTCTTCKVAVINFIFMSGGNSIKKFRVEAKSNINVDISGTQFVQIIDEEECT